MVKRTAAQKAGDIKTAWKLKRRKKYDKKGQEAPKAKSRTKFWVAGYKKADGSEVKGHWRANHHANKKGKFAKAGVGSKKQAKTRKK
ncbi:MAG: hypothetical protein ABIC95_03760 [archaeon]